MLERPRSYLLPRSKTWVEISAGAAERNLKTFRGLVGPGVRVFGVVKSNAYGHGLVEFSRVLERAGVDGFCVDSFEEAAALRDAGLKRPILVLGFTDVSLFKEAARRDVMITLSSADKVEAYLKGTARPSFHFKIDTGMHRQGFTPAELARLLKGLDARALAKLREGAKGVYTHFASAKDINYPTYTDIQLERFLKAVSILEKAGFAGLIRHSSATGGTLISEKYHFDAVRIGIGLYGRWPSKELYFQKGGSVHLEPVLSWRSVISELKILQKGEYVGYDLAERVMRTTRAAIVPVGYWHGYPRALSSGGLVLIGKKKAKVIGRVSMDMIVIDVTGIPVKLGEAVTLFPDADEAARIGSTISYELLSRINPLIERIIVT